MNTSILFAVWLNNQKNINGNYEIDGQLCDINDFQDSNYLFESFLGTEFYQNNLSNNGRVCSLNILINDARILSEAVQSSERYLDDSFNELSNKVDILVSDIEVLIK